MTEHERAQHRRDGDRTEHVDEGLAFEVRALRLPAPMPAAIRYLAAALAAAKDLDPARLEDHAETFLRRCALAHREQLTDVGLWLEGVAGKELYVEDLWRYARQLAAALRLIDAGRVPLETSLVSLSACYGAPPVEVLRVMLDDGPRYQLVRDACRKLGFEPPAIERTGNTLRVTPLDRPVVTGQ